MHAVLCLNTWEELAFGNVSIFPNNAHQQVERSLALSWIRMDAGERVEAAAAAPLLDGDKDK